MAEQEKDPHAKEGMRIRMVSMFDDPNPIEKDTEGTIRFVDDMGIIHVNWDNGRTLGVVPGIDQYLLEPENALDTEKIFKDINEAKSGGEAIKSAIKKEPSTINKSMPKATKISSKATASLSSSGVKTGQVNKAFKSANIPGLKVEDQIKGGKADNLTVADLAKRHKTTVEKIKKELETGLKVEKEHVGNDVAKATEIAMDHIFEFPDFYSNKKYGALTTEKGLKKSTKKKGIKTEITGAGGAMTGAPSSTGAYVGPAMWGQGDLTKDKIAKPGPLKNENIITKENLIKEITLTSHDNTQGVGGIEFADQDGDGWYHDDEPFWADGEIVDALAKVKTNWADDTFWLPNLDNVNDGSTLKKEDIMRMVKSRLNETMKPIQLTEDEALIERMGFYERIKKRLEDKDNQLGANHPAIKREVEKILSINGGVLPKKINDLLQGKGIEENTSFNSVFGSGFPVTPTFAAKDGQWRLGKRTIWPGGKIVQKIENSGVLNELNKIPFVKGGKYVKVKKKCTKFPYCNQGAMDSPLAITNSINGSGSYVEENMMRNIHEVAKATGKSFDEVYKIVKQNLNNH